MADSKKYNLILDSLQTLLENKKLQTISVSEIAQTAGIGKGSIYYYFPSKDAILEALVERNYEKPLPRHCLHRLTYRRSRVWP